MGRFWQTRVLMEANPIFEFVPVEAAIRQNQTECYQALADSDAQGTSTPFIEFVLKRILESLEEVLSVTGSRDLKRMIEENVVEVTGSGRMTKYRKI